MDKPQVVIASAVRTPIGAFQGVLSPATAPQLGAAAIAGAIARGGIGPADVQEVIMGCVLPAGLGQAPARQAAIGAGIPQGVPTTTINKMCGSGMKAIMMAADQIRTGDVSIAVAGGLESMSNAPYLLPKARAGIAHGSRRDARPHVLRRPAEPVRRAAHGRVCREHGAEIWLLARRPGRLCHRIHAARLEGHRQRRLRGRDHAGDGQGPQGRDRGRTGRNAVHGRPRQDSYAEARVPQGRHGDRGVFVLDFGRRCRRRTDVGRRG